ncbi:MAG: hypothetical protein IKY02_05550, partial [Lachnospiraceae bacterium]|nr:hypothetical protein [Lachnospiraceae bacterium]
VTATLYASAGTGVFAVTVFLDHLTAKTPPAILIKIGVGVILIGVHLLIEFAVIKDSKQRLCFSLIVAATLITCNLISLVTSIFTFSTWPNDWLGMILTCVSYLLVFLLTWGFCRKHI